MRYILIVGVVPAALPARLLSFAVPGRAKLTPVAASVVFVHSSTGGGSAILPATSVGLAMALGDALGDALGRAASVAGLEPHAGTATRDSNPATRTPYVRRK
jgi:hypothetical protein